MDRRPRVENAGDHRAIEAGAAILCAGGLVVFPTETVYGLGADACNALAVARIFEVKRRPEFDPLIVHVADPSDARLYGNVDSQTARELIRVFWPGPLTVVVPRTDRVPPIVTAGLATVGIRMPAHPAALSLIRSCGRAVAAPSANPFGYVSPTEARQVEEQLGGAVDLILDGGRCRVGIESTVLSLLGPVPIILRPGGVTLEAIRELIGSVELAGRTDETPQSPGRLSRHYATHTPLKITDASRQEMPAGPQPKTGRLAFTPPPHPERYAALEVLSPSGNLREAAANLFGALRRLDLLGLDCIEADHFPEEGLGVAIMDRLRRCAAPVLEEAP